MACSCHQNIAVVNTAMCRRKDLFSCKEQHQVHFADAAKPCEFTSRCLLSRQFERKGKWPMAGFETQDKADIHDETGQTGIVDLLRDHDLRPTRQRVALAELLFSKGDRHISAEALHEEAETLSIKVSLATIYNTLHQFTNADLLRAVPVDGTKTYFDTNVDNHHHFFVEDDQQVIDIPAQNFTVGMLPEPPDGMEITRVEVVVRVRRKS